MLDSSEKLARMDTLSSLNSSVKPNSSIVGAETAPCDKTKLHFGVTMTTVTYITQNTIKSWNFR